MFSLGRSALEQGGLRAQRRLSFSPDADPESSPSPLPSTLQEPFDQTLLDERVQCSFDRQGLPRLGRSDEGGASSSRGGLIAGRLRLLGGQKDHQARAERVRKVWGRLTASAGTSAASSRAPSVSHGGSEMGSDDWTADSMLVADTTSSGSEEFGIDVELADEPSMADGPSALWQRRQMSRAGRSASGLPNLAAIEGAREWIFDAEIRPLMAGDLAKVAALSLQLGGQENTQGIDLNCLLNQIEKSGAPNPVSADLWSELSAMPPVALAPTVVRMQRVLRRDPTLDMLNRRILRYVWAAPLGLDVSPIDADPRYEKALLTCPLIRSLVRWSAMRCMFELRLSDQGGQWSRDQERELIARLLEQGQALTSRVVLGDQSFALAQLKADQIQALALAPSELGSKDPVGWLEDPEGKAWFARFDLVRPLLTLAPVEDPLPLDALLDLSMEQVGRLRLLAMAQWLLCGQISWTAAIEHVRSEMTPSWLVPKLGGTALKQFMDIHGIDAWEQLKRLLECPLVILQHHVPVEQRQASFQDLQSLKPALRQLVLSHPWEMGTVLAIWPRAIMEMTEMTEAAVRAILGVAWTLPSEANRIGQAYPTLVSWCSAHRGELRRALSDTGFSPVGTRSQEWGDSVTPSSTTREQRLRQQIEKQRRGELRDREAAWQRASQALGNPRASGSLASSVFC
jgi:hypothetical protein